MAGTSAMRQPRQSSEVTERLQDVGIKAIAIHGRTRKQMYKGEADWTLIGEIANNPRIHIPVFGNGDIDSGPKALEMKNRYGVYGIMIGRASIGYPWIFREIKHFLATGEELAPPTALERVAVAKEHLEKSLEWKGLHRGVVETRRHYTNYFRGFPNIKPLRLKLVTSYEPQELFDTLEEIAELYKDFEVVGKRELVGATLAGKK